MIRFPNAKINLGLSVVRKREDGYHDLETVFYPVGLKDALEVVPNEEGACRLFISGIQVADDPEKNLVVKAYRKLQERYGIPGVDIYLYKHIPFGAGLGGGSSDASFMLLMLKDLFSLPVSEDEIEEIAASLGADCPFFCRNIPVFAAGTGNLFTPVTVSLKGYRMVIVKPATGVSTKEAFGEIKPVHPEISVREIVKRPIEAWKELLKNDFEETVFPLHPEIAAIKEKLYESGAVYASMSGSGSSVFGIFKEEVSLLNCFPDCFVWQGECEI